MRLPTSDFHLKYTVQTPFTLPEHSGSLLRGVLGRALRRAGCVHPKEEACAGACQKPGACVYSRLFDPPAPSPPPHRFLRGSTRMPPRLLPLLPPREPA
jgi:hypothetical protein